MKAFPSSKRIMNRTAAVSNTLRMKSEDERSSNFLSTIYWFNTYERTFKARHPKLLFCTPRLYNTYCFHYLNGLVLFDETKHLQWPEGPWDLWPRLHFIINWSVFCCTEFMFIYNRLLNFNALYGFYLKGLVKCYFLYCIHGLSNTQYICKVLLL